MAINLTLIETKLPKELQELAKTFSIPDKFLDEKPEIIIKILQSKSMDTNEEKQSWFNLLPLMNDEQYWKLVDILTREKQKLIEIEKKYDEKKQNIMKKSNGEINFLNYQNKMDQIKKLESEEDKVEEVDAENLLSQI